MPEKEEIQEPLSENQGEKPIDIKNEEERMEAKKGFRKALRQEDFKEDEINKLKQQLQGQYQDVPENVQEEFIQSEKVQDNLEEMAKIRMEWEEKRKTLYGPFDFKKMKDDLKNLIGKITKLFKRKK